MPQITKNAFKLWFLVAHRYAVCVKVLAGVSSKKTEVVVLCDALAGWDGGRSSGGQGCVYTH